MTKPDVSQLTTDSIEHQILVSEHIEPLEQDCELDLQSNILLRNMAGIQKSIRSHHQQWAREFMSGAKPSAIAAKHDVAHGTVLTALKKTKVQDFMTYVGRLQRLESGPTIAQRRALLWRIAKREEVGNPRTAIAAVDTLNKQEGLYIRDGEGAEGALIVNINEFKLIQGGKQGLEIVAETAIPEPLEGEFKTLTVEVPAE